MTECYPGAFVIGNDLVLKLGDGYIDIYYLFKLSIYVDSKIYKVYNEK